MSEPRRILPVGPSALLAEYDSLAATMAAFEGLAEPRPAGVVDIVPAARTILVTFGLRTKPSEIEAWLNASAMQQTVRREAAPIEIDVVYDGEDLDEVAAILNLTRESVIAIHTSNSYRVAFTGFAPGFGYLTAPDTRLNIARRASPRPRVPAGAVGLAGEFSGIYPRESPGGWQLIGHTNAVMWDENREQSALLRPGDAVRFRAVRRSVRAEAVVDTAPEVVGITVIQPGLQLLIQDGGRPGHAAEGVTASGAADRASHDAANDAVGNDRESATLEIALGGAEIRFDIDAVIAVTGADAPATIVNEVLETETLVAPGAPTAIAAGNALRFGFATHGVRTYLAVRGGWMGKKTLGSRATDTLSSLGPAPLRSGARVGIAPARPHDAVTAVVATPTALADATDVVTIDVVFGPRDDWFDASAREHLTTTEWRVSATSDRVGLRLEGATPLRRTNAAELPSEGVVRGAIQVPANGQPVIFQADHPVTGGYPVIAVVVPQHRDRLAQVPAGTTLRFRAR